MVDGSPRARHLMQTCFEIAISQRLGHLRTFPLAKLDLFGQSLYHLKLSSFGLNWNGELGGPVTAKVEKMQKTSGFLLFLKKG